MNFTFEVKKTKYFSFLEVKICRESNTFTISVSLTFSNVYTNFDSF